MTGCYHHSPADPAESPSHQFGQTVSKDGFSSLFQQFEFFKEDLVVARARVIPVTPVKEPVHILLDVLASG